MVTLSMRNPTETRRRLLTVAAQAMAQSGVEGVRVDQIAIAAGVNKRMIYHYFGDKDGLCARVLDTQLRSLSSLLQSSEFAALGQILREALPHRAESEQSNANSDAKNRQGSESATTQRRQAGIIVLRALLDLPSTDERFESPEPLDWRALITHLSHLAFDLALPESPAKKRVSLSPVVSPLINSKAP